MGYNLVKTINNQAQSDYKKPEENSWLALIHSVNQNISSESRLSKLLQQTINMTQKTLNAEAASVLLHNEKERELYFDVASGPVGNVLKRVTISVDHGIAGQVVRTGKPLIVNDVTRHPAFHDKIDDMTGFITKSLICAPLKVHKKILGVIEVLNKTDGTDFDDEDLEALETVAVTTAMAVENTQLHQTVLESYRSTISTLAATIDAKDPYTHGHSQRVMEYAVKGGRTLFLSTESMEALEYAGLLHDIGKISVDTMIINKPSPLNEDEWEMMRQHPAIGYKMMKEIPFLEKASEFVLYHHERYDGKGYPSGLKGEEIPIEARLIAVADAFDTMTTDRAYRSAISVQEAIHRLCDCSGTQFCPEAVNAIGAQLVPNSYTYLI